MIMQFVALQIYFLIPKVSGVESGSLVGSEAMALQVLFSYCILSLLKLKSPHPNGDILGEGDGRDVEYCSVCGCACCVCGGESVDRVMPNTIIQGINIKILLLV